MGVQRTPHSFSILLVFVIGILSTVLFARSLLGPTGALVHYRMSGLSDFDYVAEALRLSRYIRSEELPGNGPAADSETPDFPFRKRPLDRGRAGRNAGFLPKRWESAAPYTPWIRRTSARLSSRIPRSRAKLSLLETTVGRR